MPLIRIKNIPMVFFCTVSLVLGIGPAALSFSFPDKEWFSINGFGTIALTSSDSDLLGFGRTFHSETPVFKDSVEFRTDSFLGTQLTIRPNDRFKAVAQFVVRDYSEPSVDSLLQFAYADFHLYPGISLRLGRNPMDIFLGSDYKDVGFAYLWARPVSGVYPTMFYDYYEGGEFRYVKDTDMGLFTVIGYIGTSDLEVFLENYQNISFSFEPIYGVSLWYENGPFTFTAGYQNCIIADFPKQLIQFSNLLDSYEGKNFFSLPYIQEQMRLDGSRTEYMILGASYDDGHWHIQSEVSQYNYNRLMELAFHSGYISIGYRIKQFTPFVVFSKLYKTYNRIHIDGEMLGRMSFLEKTAYHILKNLMDDADANQSCLSLGLRWDLSGNCSLKFQWDHNWIRKDQATFWKKRPGVHMKQDETVNITSISFDFFF
ncbi:MAG: hypothetical protein CSB28_00225 [Desulfobacterales bacterium]|nr:MAG: hypothetical protein CSB28_00225 [Desulfobacterales bacterium]